MKQRPRIYYAEAQKALMWDRWKAGDTLHGIGKLFDRPHSAIHIILSAERKQTLCMQHHWHINHATIKANDSAAGGLRCGYDPRGPSQFGLRWPQCLHDNGHL